MSFLFFGMHALLHGPQDPNKLNYATIINIISKCCVNPSLQINVLQNDREFLVGQVNEKDQIISQVSFSHWSRSNDQIYQFTIHQVFSTPLTQRFWMHKYRWLLWPPWTVSLTWKCVHGKWWVHRLVRPSNPLKQNKNGSRSKSILTSFKLLSFILIKRLYSP